MRDIRICFVGDSFVNGTGDQQALGWAGRLCRLARNSDVAITYYNLGIRGNTSRDILARIEREVFSRLPTTVDSRVVLSFGVNDTAQVDGVRRLSERESIDNFEAIVDTLKSKYKILMVGPPPVIDDERNAQIKALNNAFHAKSEALGVPYIELFSQLESDVIYKKEVVDNDGAHPRTSGYEKLARIIHSSGEWWF